MQMRPQCDPKWIRCACRVSLWISLWKSIILICLLLLFLYDLTCVKEPSIPPATPKRQLHSRISRVPLDDLRKCLSELLPKTENHRLKPVTLVVDLTVSLLRCRAFVVSNFIIERDLNRVSSRGSVAWLKYVFVQLGWVSDLMFQLQSWSSSHCVWNVVPNLTKLYIYLNWCCRHCQFGVN